MATATDWFLSAGPWLFSAFPRRAGASAMVVADQRV
jgi:hypothetical protein